MKVKNDLDRLKNKDKEYELLYKLSSALQARNDVNNPTHFARLYEKVYDRLDIKNFEKKKNMLHTLLYTYRLTKPEKIRTYTQKMKNFAKGRVKNI